MFANTMMGATNIGFPDVCLTPAGPALVPTPYPNLSMTTMAVPTLPTILIEGTPAQNLLSIVPMSQGDVGNGVASGVCMGPTTPTLGATTCLFEAMPATRMTSMNNQNLTNCPAGMTVVPSQFGMLLLAP